MSRPDSNSAYSGNTSSNAAAIQQYQMASMQYYSGNLPTYANSGGTDAWNYSNYGYGSSAGSASQYSGPSQAGRTVGNQGNNGGVPVASQQQYYNMSTPAQYPQQINYSCPPPPPPPPPPQGGNSFQKTSSGPSSGHRQPSGGLPPLMHQPPPTSRNQPLAPTLPPPPPPPPPPEVTAEEDEPITLSCPPMPPTFPWMCPSMFAPLAAIELNSPPESERPPSITHSNYGIDQPMKKIFPKEDQQPTKPLHMQWTDPIDPALPQVLKNMFQPLFCKLCNLSLSSAIVASDHYKGKRHKKCIEVWLADHPDVSLKRNKVQVDETRNIQNSAPIKRTSLGSESSKSSFESFRNGPIKNNSLLKNFSRNTFGQENPSNDKRNIGKFSDNQSSKNSNFGVTQWIRNDEWNRNDDGNVGGIIDFAGIERNTTGQSMLNGESSEHNPSRGGNKRWNSNNSQTSFRSGSPASDNGGPTRVGDNWNNSGRQNRDGDFGGWSNPPEDSRRPLPLMSVDMGAQRENASRFPLGKGGFKGKANPQEGNDSRKSFLGNRPFQGKGRSFQDTEPSFTEKGPPFQQNLKRNGANANQVPPAKKEKTDYKGAFSKCEVCNIVLNSKPSADQHYAGKRHRDNLLNHQKTGQFDHVDRTFDIGASFREKSNRADTNQFTPSADAEIAKS
ncbi:unnamed protein product [Allacma fusca]|uniref:U1-type domain-containing protein n=1 Tax=Allacma fusca TaxID=39272 RepID=A0A8J2L750_9HEXA|nr:unnamed protein product [Allacma fusca]